MWESCFVCFVCLFCALTLFRLRRWSKKIRVTTCSSLEDNLTTKKTEVLNDPELRLWAGEGITERQVQNWMTEFQTSLEEMVMSLRYGRFDILERRDV